MGFDITSALIVMGSLGLLFGAGLAIASKILAVSKDARVEQIEDVLPGANCGACGAPGCSGFAEGVVAGKYPVAGCTAGGADVTLAIAGIMGTDAGELIKTVAVIRCRGDKTNCPDRAVYSGVSDCRAAMLINEGAKGCTYGCLGLGTCVDACQFNALEMAENGLPVVDDDNCTGCGACVTACPRDIIELIPFDQSVYMGCVSKDFGKSVKAVCKVGCIGCGMCAKEKITPNEMITMDGKIPVIHYDKIENSAVDLAMAIEKCPTKSFALREVAGKDN